MPRTPKPNDPSKPKAKPRVRKPSTPPAKAPTYQPGVVGKFPFDHEMATFNARLPELLRGHEGQYVVIRGEVVAGVSDRPGEAMGLGYDTFGDGGFMIRKVTAEEQFYALPRPVTY